jgi:energy-converting hydrogenase Eha subunit E
VALVDTEFESLGIWGRGGLARNSYVVNSVSDDLTVVGVVLVFILYHHGA